MVSKKTLFFLSLNKKNLFKKKIEKRYKTSIGKISVVLVGVVFFFFFLTSKQNLNNYFFSN
jgi:hypothetical protein